MKKLKKVQLIKSFMLTDDNSGITPPLGLMYVAGALRKRGDWNIKITDSRLFNGNIKNVLSEVRRFEPDIVGISSITMEAPYMQKLAAHIKSEFPRTVIVTGGPHPSMYPEQTISDKNVDFVVFGEGEKTFPDLLEALRDGDSADVEKVQGIVRKRDSEIVRHPPQPFIEDLDSIPFPAWDLIDRDGYANRKSMANLGKRKYMGLFTSRACPFKCAFCHGIFGRGFRPHSPGYVLDMMETLVKDFGISEYEIYDDIFNWDAARMDAICEGIGKRNLNLRLVFPNGLRGDIMTDAQAGKLVEAGTIYVCLAIDSGSPRIQRMIHKNINLDKLRDTMGYFAKRHIYQVGFLMLGFPTETLEEQKLTVNYALHSPLNAAYFFIATPFQGTELFNMAGPEAIKRAGSDYSDHDYFKGNYNMSDVPDNVFFKFQREAFRKFYLNPDRIYRIIRDHPNRASLMDYFIVTLRRVFLKQRGNQHFNAPLYDE